MAEEILKNKRRDKKGNNFAACGTSVAVTLEHRQKSSRDHGGGIVREGLT